MRYTTPGQHKTVAALRAHLRGLDPAFDCVDQVRGSDGPLGNSFAFGNKVLPNRFALHPMEGWDGNREGGPSELTLRRWERFGASGAALIWGGEAFAVCAEGRANPRQLYRHPAQAGTYLAQLLAALRRGQRASGLTPDQSLVGLQLTHSGRFARPNGPFAPQLAAHIPSLDKRFGIDPEAPLLTDAELEQIAADFVRTARLAYEQGFDFVDVKCCHGYLLHELLGARSRAGSYGGSFEQRTLLLRRIIAEIRREAPALGIGVRLSFGDMLAHEPNPESGLGQPVVWDRQQPYDYGFGISAANPLEFDATEPLRLLALLKQWRVQLINITLGSPYYCPHIQRPAAYPPSDGYEPPEDPLASVLRQLRATRVAKKAEPDLVFVGTGYTYLQEWLAHVAEYELAQGHVDFIGLGRMALSYPDLPRDVLAGRTLQRKLICRTFSDCTTAPRKGLISGCYPLDPHYRQLPEAELLRLKKRE